MEWNIEFGFGTDSRCDHSTSILKCVVSCGKMIH